MSDEVLNELSREIYQMKSAEKKMELSFWVQKIIENYYVISELIANLPKNFPLIKEGEDLLLINNSYLTSKGVMLGEDDIIVKKDRSLVVKKRQKIVFEFSKSKIIGQLSFIKNLSEKISKMTSAFREDLSEKISEYKKDLLERVKNF